MLLQSLEDDAAGQLPLRVPKQQPPRLLGLIILDHETVGSQRTQDELPHVGPPGPQGPA